MLLSIVLLFHVIQVRAFPITVPENPGKITQSSVLDFMKKFGYLEKDDPSSGALYTDDGIADTIKMVQKFGAIDQTGILDNATLKLMASPRCGNPDVIRSRPKRFILGSKGWNKRTITYFIANWPSQLTKDIVQKNIQLALDTWGKYGHIKFYQSQTQDADIIVAFGSGYHGDHFPFDGPGNILAHAFFPFEMASLGGDIHFDGDENWTDGDEDGTDFFTVALHELGHSLGLGHSHIPNSIMFPYYQGHNSDKFQLGYDDILGMYELYIRRNLGDDPYFPQSDGTTESTTSTTTESTRRWWETSTVHTTTRFTESTTEITEWESSTLETSTSNPDSTHVIYEGDDESVEVHKTHDPKHNIPPTNSPTLPNICEGYFDAVAAIRTELFIFKGQYIWRLSDFAKVLPGYPVKIYQMFPDLPTNVTRIDAAYERPDGMIVLFTGNHLWVYDGKSFVENSPLPLSTYGLPTYLDSIDAVQIWGRNSKTYLYKNDRFWRYNETSKQLDEGYPQHMEKWRGVPEKIEAATTWKGITYFFQAELYWKFDNDWVIITEQSPLPSPQIWLGCPEDPQTMRRLL